MYKKIFFRWFKLAIIIYCAVGIALYYLQEFILFHPTPFNRSAKYGFADAYVEANIHYDKKTNLNIIEFKSADTTLKGVVLYFHGNRKNVSFYAKFAANFTKMGYETWMLDYPGFGKSTGDFSEQKLYSYALQVYKLARARFKPGQIIIYGKSLGACIASQLASIRDCKYLILETPCYSMTSLVAHYLPIYPVKQMLHFHFPNDEYLQQVTAPVVIFQGTDDGLVPYNNASMLKGVLKSNDEFVTIQGGAHNNLNEFPVYHQKLDSLLH
jgi:uncharacterized protein